MSAFELAQVFSNVTNRLITEFETHPDLYEKVDVETITSEGWLIKFCVFLEKMTEDQAYDTIVRILKWRKTKSFADKLDTDFPKELYETGAAFPYNQDKDGNLTLCFRLDRRLSQWGGKVAKKFLLHQLSKVDKLANGNSRFVVLVDYSNSQLAYSDQYLVFYLFKLARHFPACRYFIHYNANPLTKRMIQYTYRKPIDKFAEKKQIFDHFHDKYLPQYLGGTCNNPIGESPADCVSIVDCYESLGIDKKSAVKRRDQLAKQNLVATR
jgi:hypothetical protein